jgi:DNA-directed RNA polymerase subunit L
MNPIVEQFTEKQDELTFTISGLNVSLANAIRRTILSDINVVVFRTSPYEKNDANILVNTSRLNNEIIKQRLSCIPIFIKNIEEFPLDKYYIEVKVENISSSLMYVTTEDFVIKDVATGKSISEAKTREIFPPSNTGHFIDFVRLRPKISDELPGESIHLTCKFSIGNAKEDGMFNVVSTCSYGFTPDKDKIQEVLGRKRADWKQEGKTDNEIDFESKNWELLDGLRITKKDCFDFTIQTIGIYSNFDLLNKACDILIDKFNELNILIETNEIIILKSQNTMSNSFDIILENEDYTIGKAIEYLLYTKFYEGIKTLTYCGYKKMHPHDSDSIIRLAYKENVDIQFIKQNLLECVADAIQIYKKVKKEILKINK